MRSLKLLGILAATATLSTSFAAARGEFSSVSSAPVERSTAGTRTPRVPGSSTATIAADERAALRAAEARASGLEEMRGGEIVLSDSDVQLVLITAAVVILLILIF